MKYTLIVLTLLIALAGVNCLAEQKKDPSILRYGDGKPDGKRSISGSGETIKFSLPETGGKVKGIRIHGSRYGEPKPPKEDFKIHFLNEDLTETIHTEKAPYSLPKYGADQKWMDIKFKQPFEVPQTFWVVLDFNATQTKGVYISYDTSTGGGNSKMGLPGESFSDVDFNGDWMVEVSLVK